jgi:hypothetical protein
MGFYDPCPGDPKLLLVEYTFHGHKYKVGNAVTLPYVPACDKRRKFFFFHEQVFLTACLLCWQVMVDDYEALLIPQDIHQFWTVPDVKATSKRFWVISSLSHIFCSFCVELSLFSVIP